MGKMFCTKCGKEIEAGMRFCKHCGELLGDRGESAAPGGEPESADEKDLVPDGKAPDEGKAAAEVRNNENDGKKKKIIAGCIALVVTMTCIVGITAYLNNQKDAEYNAKIAEASQYLQELDYEKAETAYLDAIDIEPKRSEAYLELSDVYVAQQEFDAALDILEEGKKKTGDKKTFEQKIEEVTKQSEADPKSEQYKAYYELVMEYQEKYGEAGYDDKLGDNSVYLTGCGIVKLFDFNKDGNEELIVGYLDESERGIQDLPNHKFEVWAWNDGELINALPATSMVLDGIFTAVKDGDIYIEATTYPFIENKGLYVKTQYMKYERGKFVTEYDRTVSETVNPPEYFVNGEQVGSYEEVEELTEDFPKVNDSLRQKDFMEKDTGELRIGVFTDLSGFQSILDVTERNIEILRSAATVASNPEDAAADESEADLTFTGQWVTDPEQTNRANDMTMSQMFGTMLKYSSCSMEIDADASFSYSVGTFGGEGTWKWEKDQMVFTVYSQLSGREESGKLISSTDGNSASCLIMPLETSEGVYNIYWKRE